ncbi:hypothetical protein U5922_006795 [Aquicoccus sp. G2-2]|uniref:hypothetical protein n=1 Tax=Aquicoccus sp. G2-2 TaxID=3092120 RepID=UPI002ADF8FEB|nr:hypothetical protein [Aquicoccus sp. G2-2]MEA1113196.1 hypothetical protein [Aquicoccus sp. G2-2]
MFHDPQPLVPALDWAANPQRGDVVLFRFPVANSTDQEPPKRRPCLVLDVRRRGAECFVELAYGTSSNGRANRGYELIVKQPKSRAHAGLNKSTRFVCARRIFVSVKSKGFDCPDGSTSPLIGCLDEALMEQMNAIRAKIQAEADIAAHYREERRREQAR